MAWHGETVCRGTYVTGKPCTAKAYYGFHGEARCGRHSKKGQRTKLPVNPITLLAREHAIEMHKQSVEQARRQDRRGQCQMAKLVGAFAVKVPLINGFISVLPNFSKGTTRKDGALNMSSLSPKSIGPVNHGQPGLPPALNLENFHQGSKKFASQTMDEFRVTQKAMFTDPIPHRHHPHAGSDIKRNIPEFFVWIDQRGAEHHLTYVESRQFYCHFMERALLSLTDFARLRDLLDAGYNLLICGFDAYQPNQDIYRCYLDESKPFGHELVLYTMLVFSPEQWPWRLHKTFVY